MVRAFQQRPNCASMPPRSAERDTNTFFWQHATIGRACCFLFLLIGLTLAGCVPDPGGAGNAPSGAAADCQPAPGGSDEAALATFFTSCCPATTTPASAPQSGVTPVKRVDAQTPHRTIAVWLDITGSYPRRYLEQAKQALANMIDASALPGEQGMTLFISLVSHDSWTPESTLLVLQTPPVPADPPLPTLEAAPHPTGNQISDAQRDQETQSANCQRLMEFYATLTENHAQLRSIQQTVKQQASDPLRHLKLPPVDNTATDLWGAVERSASWFQEEQGERWFLAVTDLWGNTNAQRTGSFDFAGVRVRVLWHFCGDAASASQCLDNQSWWQAAFIHAGAASVKMLDPAASEALGANLLS